MKVRTTETRCAGCNLAFPSPDLGDFSYGQFIFFGVGGTAHAFYAALECPVWDFISALVDKHMPASRPEARGQCIQHACTIFADRVDGQHWTLRHVCPHCLSQRMTYWGGTELGEVDVPVATFTSFLGLPLDERIARVEQFISACIRRK
jgi:hypothetical protein